MATVDDVNAEIARREIARRAAPPTDVAGHDATTSIRGGVSGFKQSVLGALGIDPGDIEGGVAAITHPHAPDLAELVPDAPTKGDVAMALAEPVATMSFAPMHGLKALVRSLNPEAFADAKAKEVGDMESAAAAAPTAEKVGFALPIAGAVADAAPATASALKAAATSPATSTALRSLAKAAPIAGQAVGAVKGGFAAGPFGVAVGAGAGKRAGQFASKGLSKLADLLERPKVTDDFTTGLDEAYAATRGSPSAPSSPVPDVEEVVSPVPEGGDKPPSLLKPQTKTPDWHFNPAEEPPPAVQAEIDALAARVKGGATTPLPKTGKHAASAYSPEGFGTPTGKKMGADLVATEHPEDFDEARANALESLGDDGVPTEAPTRELSLPELRDQEALALREGRPTKVQEAIRAFKPYSGDIPSPADLAAKDAAANAAVQRMPLASSSPFSQAKVDKAAAELLAKGMKPVEVARELFKRGLTSQQSMQDPWFAKALANYRAAQIGNLK